MMEQSRVPQGDPRGPAKRLGSRAEGSWPPFRNQVHCRQCTVHSLVCSASKFLILRLDLRNSVLIGDRLHGEQCTSTQARFSRVRDRRSPILSFWRALPNEGATEFAVAPILLL
jgi:hypothetical protein